MKSFSSHSLQYLLALYILFLLPGTTYSISKAISVNYFNIAELENELRVDAEINYRLNSEIREALANGITLIFQVEVQIKTVRDWMWDKTIASNTQTNTLRYHALSKQFIWEGLETGASDTFPDLESALSHQGRISALYIAEMENLNQEEQHVVIMRSRLITDKLPLPLRMKSYFSPKWRLNSGWYEWPL